MAIRTIVKVGDPVLSKKCRAVENIDDRIITLLDDMIDTLYDSGGVGLAAPQVGVLKRIAVIDVGDGLEHFDAGVHTHYHFYCNACNSVLDVDLPNLHPEQYLPDGFTPHRHQLVFFGECSNCKGKNQKIN